MLGFGAYFSSGSICRPVDLLKIDDHRIIRISILKLLYEETLELVALGGISSRAGWFLELLILCAVSHHARFSVGKSFAVLRWWSLALRRAGTSIWKTPTLSRQNLRPHLGHARSARFRSLCLRCLLHGAPIATFDRRAPGWPEGSGLHATGPKRQTGSAYRSAFAERRGAHFLSRPLVTTVQLRVAEFPAAASGFQHAGHPRCCH
jgi:hypothetical protein